SPNSTEETTSVGLDIFFATGRGSTVSTPATSIITPRLVGLRRHRKPGRRGHETHAGERCPGCRSRSDSRAAHRLQLSSRWHLPLRTESGPTAAPLTGWFEGLLRDRPLLTVFRRRREPLSLAFSTERFYAALPTRAELDFLMLVEFFNIQ